MVVSGFEDARAEVTLRAVRGRSLRRVRGAATETTEWAEEVVGVAVELPDGRAGRAVGACFGRAADVGAEAARLALGLAPSLEAGAEERLPRVPPVVSDPTGVPEEPAAAVRLREVLDRLHDATLSVDHRISALDAAAARSAVARSYVASSSGRAVHQRQAAALLRGAVLARDGRRIASAAHGWAGAELSDLAAEELGERLGRWGVLELVGVAGVPPQGRVLLLPAAVAELTFACAPALLGLVASEAVERARDGGAALPAALTLAERSAMEPGMRCLPVDGAGRPLVETEIIASGRLLRVTEAHLPALRPAAGDAPVPGWLQLAWSWGGQAEVGSAEDVLDRRLGTGFRVDGLRVVRVDPARLVVHGTAWGHWLEDGRVKHALARVPVRWEVVPLLCAVEAAGRTATSAHPSGTVRSISLLVSELPLGSGLGGL